MAKIRMRICSNCNEKTTSVVNKCPSCGEFGTMIEFIEEERLAKSSRGFKSEAIKMKDVLTTEEDIIVTGNEEFNRVMGGGMVSDGVTSLSARPGTGKSTLLLQIANNLAELGKCVLYNSSEESDKQIKKRANRVLKNNINENLYITTATSVEQLEHEIKSLDCDIIICDSLNKMISMECPNSRSGSTVHAETCLASITELCKRSNKPRASILICHVTKEDDTRGSMTIQHDTDTVLKLEGDEGDDLRILRAQKNRFGELDTGLFIMSNDGMVELRNPSDYFVTKRDDGELTAGVSLSVVNEGSRPIIVEVESLVTINFNQNPARVATCLKKDNLNILLSIIQQSLGFDMNQYNVIVNTTGNLKIAEPAISLAIIMSILSNYQTMKKNMHCPIPHDYVFIAEVGLTGSLKRVQGLERRLKELDRMGYGKVFVAKKAVTDTTKFSNIEIIECASITEVFNKVFREKISAR